MDTTDASVELWKNTEKLCWEDIKQISSWSNNHNNFPVIIAGMAFKFENIKFQSSDHTGNSFNAYHDMVLNNKTHWTIIFGI